ncbi:MULTISPECIES: hypothetical protein [Fischerella]|nr:MULTISPECIES: hypothetical protein [Fischerella]
MVNSLAFGNLQGDDGELLAIAASFDHSVILFICWVNRRNFY